MLIPQPSEGGMESTFPKFVDGKQFIWNAHDIDTIMRCPRLYSMKTLEGWRWKGFGAATSWGKVVHYGIEVLDTLQFYGATKNEALDQAIVAVVQHYGEMLQESDDTARTLESAIRAIVWRADAFWDNQLQVATMPDGKPALEVEFEVPIPGLGGHRFRGKIDKVGVMDKEQYLIDLKTTKSQLTKRFFNYYFPNNQVMAYLWVCKKQLGLDINGFVIDGIHTAVNFTRFARHLVTVTNAQINEWEYSMLEAINRVLQYREENNFPVNFQSCSNMGGCDFIDVCSVTPAQRESQLEQEFVKQPHREMDIDYEVTYDV